jgi:hypothetical protein
MHAKQYDVTKKDPSSLNDPSRQAFPECHGAAQRSLLTISLQADRHMLAAKRDMFTQTGSSSHVGL